MMKINSEIKCNNNSSIYTDREKFKLLIFTSSLMDYITDISKFYKVIISKLYIEENLPKTDIVLFTEYVISSSYTLFMDIINYHRKLSLELNSLTPNTLNTYKEYISERIRLFIENIKIRFNNILMDINDKNCISRYIEVFHNEIIKEEIEKMNIPHRNGEFYDNAKYIIKLLSLFIKSLILYIINCETTKKNSLYIENSIIDISYKYGINMLEWIKQNRNIDKEKIEIIKINEEIPDWIISSFL